MNPPVSLGFLLFSMHQNNALVSFIYQKRGELEVFDGPLRLSRHERASWIFYSFSFNRAITIRAHLYTSPPPIVSTRSPGCTRAAT